MDKRTLTALQGSIAKWRTIVEETGSDNGTANCPLCKEFNEQRDEDGEECFGCPVRAKANSPYCENTPYRKWTDEHDRLKEGWAPFPKLATTPRLVELAQAELDFLRSLLP